VSRSSRKCISSSPLLLVALAAAVLAGLLLPGTAQAQAASASVTRTYTEAHGASLSTVQYRTTRDGTTIQLASLEEDSTEEIRWSPGMGTIAWKVTEPKEGNDFQARRSGDIIHVTGTLKGRAVDRQVKVDGAPWYQIFGPLMDELLPAGTGQREFWVVDPSDLVPHKMQVRRVGTERLTIRGAAVDTAKIHFSPAGALAPFWGADFWYRQGDGLWVTSRLPEGGAVTVSTIEELSP